MYALACRTHEIGLFAAVLARRGRSQPFERIFGNVWGRCGLGGLPRTISWGRYHERIRRLVSRGHASPMVLLIGHPSGIGLASYGRRIVLLRGVSGGRWDLTCVCTRNCPGSSGGWWAKFAHILINDSRMPLKLGRLRVVRSKRLEQ